MFLEGAHNPATIVVDAEYITSGWRRRCNFDNGSNLDLWSRFWGAIDSRRGAVSFIKMKSHMGVRAIVASSSPLTSYTLG